MSFLFRKKCDITALQSYNLKSYVMSHLSYKIGTIVRDFSKPDFLPHRERLALHSSPII